MPTQRDRPVDAVRPWFASEAKAPAADARRHAPATARNRDAILAELNRDLPEAGLVLEVASGSGEHVVHFAAALPHLVWQPSDPEPAALASIAAWAGDDALANLLPPVLLDASASEWPISTAGAILCCNMVHIAPWDAAQGLFAGAGRLLATGAPLILYGPFIEDGVETAPSNVSFDASLRQRDPAWGLREATALDALAASHGFRPTRRAVMPANNLLLVWRRI